MKTLAMVLLLAGLADAAIAAAVEVPEISPASGAGALTLVAGALLVIRGRRRKV